MTSAGDMCVVVGDRSVWWVDQQGQVLRQYGQQPDELSGALHVIQHSKGPLLITDWEKHRVVLLSNDATRLQQLSDVEHPSTVHLDAQAGLLFVAHRNNKNNMNVKVFQVCLKTTRKLCTTRGRAASDTSYCTLIFYVWLFRVLHITANEMFVLYHVQSVYLHIFIVHLFVAFQSLTSPSH